MGDTGAGDADGVEQGAQGTYDGRRAMLEVENADGARRTDDGRNAKLEPADEYDEGTQTAHDGRRAKLEVAPLLRIKCMRGALTAANGRHWSRPH